MGQRYKADEIKDQVFYQVPKALFNNSVYKADNEHKRGLSLSAKMVYAILRDRMLLSEKNGWVNKNNEIFLKYSRSNLAEICNCSEKTITKIMKELSQYNLIEEVRVGLNKCNEIYICRAVELSIEEKEPQTLENQGHVKSSVPEQKKLPLKNRKKFGHNDTNVIDTNINETTTKEDVVVSNVKTENEELRKQLIADLKRLNIKQSTIKTFLQKYSVEYIYEKIHILEEYAQKSNIVSYEAVLRKALNENWVSIEKQRQTNETEKIKRIQEVNQKRSEEQNQKIIEITDLNLKSTSENDNFLQELAIRAPMFAQKFL